MSNAYAVLTAVARYPNARSTKLNWCQATINLFTLWGTVV
jgi:hypothetical protein